MGERLERLRDDVRARLGSLLSGPAPDDQAVDLALADGMTSLVATFPILEADVTVVTTGYTQDVGALLPDLMSFLDVTYPYVEGCPPAPREFYQVVGLGVVRFYGAEPSAGDKMLVQYRPRYRLAGLQGDSEDTLPERYEPALAQAAVAHLMWIRRRASVRMARSTRRPTTWRLMPCATCWRPPKRRSATFPTGSTIRPGRR